MCCINRTTCCFSFLQAIYCKLFWSTQGRWNLNETKPRLSSGPGHLTHSKEQGEAVDMDGMCTTLMEKISII